MSAPGSEEGGHRYPLRSSSRGPEEGNSSGSSGGAGAPTPGSSNSSNSPPSPAIIGNSGPVHNTVNFNSGGASQMDLSKVMMQLMQSLTTSQQAMVAAMQQQTATAQSASERTLARTAAGTIPEFKGSVQNIDIHRWIITMGSK